MRVAAAIGFVVILVVTVAVGSRYLQARAAGQEVAQELQPAADNTDSLVVAMAEMSRGIRGYVITQKALSLEPYVEGVNGSERNLDALRTLLSGHEPALIPQLDAIVVARQKWLDEVSRPIIKEIRSGRQQSAVDRIGSAEATQSYDVMEATASRLQDSIDARRATEFSQLEIFSEQLLGALLISLAILLIGLIAGLFLMRRWILKPLDRLRYQLRTVARGEHETPIEPSGPIEIEKTGHDAEEMRRQLVTEIDEARMAREGLAQDAPVVAAIREELTREPVASADGIEIFGDLQPAEGVLAGDWWDSYELPDGRIAVVVTDISGHGPEAGIAGLRLKTAISTVLATGASLEEAMARGAELFAETYSRFATCVGVSIDRASGEVTWCNAGHLSPLLITEEGAEVDLEPTGPLLSAIGGEWVSRSRSMGSGDMLLMWTDGLTESRNEAGDQLEDSGLRRLLHQTGEPVAAVPSEIVPAVLAAARNRAIDWRRDDVTLISIKFNTSS